MTVNVRRWILWALAVVALGVGVWAGFLPQLWYDRFPGFGMTWLPPLGPYNEHLSRDVGSMYLAGAALSAIAALRPRNNDLVQATGVFWFVFGLPHFVFHVLHLSIYPVLDQVLNVVLLGAYLVVSPLLLLPLRERDRRDPRVRA